MATRRQNREMVRMLNGISSYNTKSMATEYIVGGGLNAIKNKLGLEFDISQMEMQKAFQWIKKHDKNYDKHISNPQSILTKDDEKTTTKEQYINDKMFIMKLDKATFAYVNADDSVFSRSNYGRNDNNSNMPASLKIYIFGRKMLKYAKELANGLSITKEFLTMYKVSGEGNGYGRPEEGQTYFKVIASDLHTRSIDTLFFDDNAKEKCVAHVNKFLSNEGIYKERSLLYKTGIILHGPAGTGKSSLATALATYYGYDIISIDMAMFAALDVDTLVESINADNLRYIILLEDIDTAIKDRDAKGEDKADKEQNKAINKLLQFLDSSTSPTNVIFIATTNHIDKLDSAILRDGRFDITVEVKELSIDNIDKMCKSFNLNSNQINNIKSKIKAMGRKSINQSKLQNMILAELEESMSDNKKTSEEVVNDESADKIINVIDPGLTLYAESFDDYTTTELNHK